MKVRKNDRGRGRNGVTTRGIKERRSYVKGNRDNARILGPEHLPGMGYLAQRGYRERGRRAGQCRDVVAGVHRDLDEDPRKYQYHY